MTGLKRNEAQKLLSLLEMFPAVVIIGSRQTGKTTLSRETKPDWHYVDLEQPSTLDRIKHDPDFFFQQHPERVIIDEAQEYPDLFKVLRGVIDDKRKQKGRFILTGSSNPELIDHVTESLAGRVAIIELGTLKANEIYEKPLSKFYDMFAESLCVENLPMDLPPLTVDQMRHVWLKGGYPEPIISNDDAFYAQWMQNYYANYLNRDIAKLFPKLNRTAYRRFIQMLSQLSGTILNKRDIARSVEVSEKTIRDYLNIADGTFIWRELLSYENNVTKAIVKMPKGHFRDTGLLHYLLGINKFDALYHHPAVGRSFEVYVIEEIIKGLNSTMLTQWGAHYYRTRGGAEIDLILEGPFGTLPIEIKHGFTVKRKQLIALEQFIKERDLPFGLVINQAPEVMWLAPKILQLPVGWL